MEKWMLDALDLGANYWSLWTESENMARYHERYPNGFDTLGGAWVIEFALRGSGKENDTVRTS